MTTSLMTTEYDQRQFRRLMEIYQKLSWQLQWNANWWPDDDVGFDLYRPTPPAGDIWQEAVARWRARSLPNPTRR